MRFVFLLAALSLASCTCTCDADALVRQMAAPGAVDCGRARTIEQREAVTVCIEEAMARGEPFMGAWPFQGVDSEVRAYAVQDGDGAVWMLGFDGGVSGSCPNLEGSRCTGPLERRSTTFDGELLACDQNPTSERILCHR